MHDIRRVQTLHTCIAYIDYIHGYVHVLYKYTHNDSGLRSTYRDMTGVVVGGRAVAPVGPFSIYIMNFNEAIILRLHNMVKMCSAQNRVGPLSDPGRPRTGASVDVTQCMCTTSHHYTHVMCIHMRHAHLTGSTVPCGCNAGWRGTVLATCARMDVKYRFACMWVIITCTCD